MTYKKGENLQVRVRGEDWFEPACNVHIPLSPTFSPFLYLPYINSVAKHILVGRKNTEGGGISTPPPRLHPLLSYAYDGTHVQGYSK